jgi:hypothetical protein
VRSAFRLFFLSGAVPASFLLAQTPAESTGWSGCVSISVVSPADSRTETSLGGALDIEHQVSKLVSIGAIAGIWTGGSDLEQDSKERYLALIGTYKWNGGRLRPFVQLGGGLYRLEFQFQSRNRFAPRESETRGGGLGGAGVDLFLSNSIAAEASARYHLVADASGVHPDFLEAQLGLRFLW